MKFKYNNNNDPSKSTPDSREKHSFSCKSIFYRIFSVEKLTCCSLEFNQKLNNILRMK